ncbi:MAG: biotin--[acetyl-CoA-carboxylase] ligase, partial [Chitinophagaceae bacterium]
MKEEKALFYLLDSVDSTNNYAMANVHAGMATHGMAWFANEQTNGKGQRGKSWEAASGKNIILSIAIKPPVVLQQQPFLLSCLVATACAEFMQSHCAQHIAVKWPNDLFWRDRKAGGILIENKLSGDDWKWAIIGIGINVNQTEFETARNQPVSLQEIAGRELNPETLTRQLHQF